MIRRMSTDRDFLVEYSYKGQSGQRIITLSAGQYGTADMREYNARVMIRQSAACKTAAEYDSFKIESVTEAPPLPTH